MLHYSVFLTIFVNDMIYKNDILSLHKPQRFPDVGDMLISEPFLLEPYFMRSVVLMVNHSDSSDVGLVLNNITDFSLADAVEGIVFPKPIPLYCGGPVGQNRLFVVHTLGDIIPESVPVADGVYINGDMRIIKEYINSGCVVIGKMRFFVGYSGWDSNQLAGELERHSWAVLAMNSTISRSLLLGEGNDYWLRHVDMLGDDFSTWKLCPVNPGMN